MGTLKGVIIAVALAFGARETVGMQMVENYNFTTEWLLVAYSSFPPMVTKVHEHLVYVTFPSDFTIKIETSTITSSPCIIPSTLLKEAAGENVTAIAAESLGNGKIIVILSESKEPNRSTVWLYAIDLPNCSHNLGNFTLDASIESVEDVLEIVPYQASFDIFLESEIHCDPGSICSLRFNDKSILVDGRKSVVPYEGEGWDIIATKDYDPSTGYLYVVVSNKTNSTILQLVDANFEILHKIQVNVSGSMTYWHAEDGATSLCFGLSSQELECVHLDSQMKIKVEKRLSYDNYVNTYSIFRLRNSDTAVLTIHATNLESSNSSTYVQQLGLDGKVSTPVKFQEYVCENVYEMQTFQMKEGLVCTSAICPNVINVKCLNSGNKS